MPTPTSVTPPTTPADETHFEWLERLALHADRQSSPFTYGGSENAFERRRWDIKAWSDLFPPKD